MITLELTQEQRVANARTHIIGELPADECYRCIRCEIGAWNAWKERCTA
jgi:hypothetical protein